MCKACPVGTFAEQSGSFMCSHCPEGRYSDTQGLQEVLYMFIR